MNAVHRILLGEDDPEDRDLIHLALRSTGRDTEVHDAADGHAVMRFLRAAMEQGLPLPKLVLLDLRMPRQDGFSVLEEIRADRRLRNLPVVVLSTSENPADVHRCYALGANSYVSKPIGVRRFAELMETLLTYWFSVVQLPVVAQGTS